MARQSLKLFVRNGHCVTFKTSFVQVSDEEPIGPLVLSILVIFCLFLQVVLIRIVSKTNHIMLY